MGELDGTTVLVGVGRFGPYVRHGNEYVSIPKEMDPMAVTFEEAVRMLSEKKAKRGTENHQAVPRKSGYADFEWSLRTLHCLPEEKL